MRLLLHPRISRLPAARARDLMASWAGRDAAWRFFGLRFSGISRYKSVMFCDRLAQPSDMPALQALMTASIRQLLPQFLTPEKVEASFAVMGVDSQLIEDRTYFILEEDGVMAGCGGWSRRATLFGHSHTAGRDSRLLDPKSEPARIRAMYTAPAFVRRGVGRRILALCEAAARAEGFTRAELGATAGGEPLYRACGYSEIERLEVPTPNGVSVPITRMGKAL
jgi:GNAT superfamily N-acetyltransferase